MITFIIKIYKKWRREPLVHFVIIGFVLFVLHGWVTSKAKANRIFLPRTHIEALSQDYLRKTGSLPTAEEQSWLVESLIRDEVFIREALEMGMDEGDPIIRRRLIQKMRFFIEELNPIADPTEDELKEYFLRHRKQYDLPKRISLRHVFINQTSTAEPWEKRATAFLDKLSSGTDPDSLGDPFIRGTFFRQRTQKEITEIFGARFAETVFSLPAGDWTGPIKSSYGIHLVLIESEPKAEPSTFEKMRPQVIRHLKAKRREEANRSAINRLKEKYDIEIEKEVKDASTTGEG